jgi:hypothetical protein
MTTTHSFVVPGFSRTFVCRFGIESEKWPAC